MNDLARRFADLRQRPLPNRLAVGVLSALVGVIGFHAIGALIDDCHAYAAFYPVVQIAGLAGGLAGAATAALASTLIVYFSAAPFASFWAGAVLLFVSAALASCAGERLRSAPESEVRARRRGEPRADGLAAASPTFESIAATITHDLTQPLAAAVAYLQTVRRLLSIEGEGRGPSISATVDKAAAQLARAGRLVVRLRDFLAHGPPRVAAIPLHALLLDAIGGQRGDAGPILRLDARRDVVVADSAQIEQLFVELAQAAAPAEVVTIATSSDDSFVTVRCALPDFDETAADCRTADLSLWRATVEAHRGAFRTEQERDGGLTIEFTLPLAVRGG